MPGVCKFKEIGICGLSCRLCPAMYRDGESRCGGCKSPERMKVGCTFIRCVRDKPGLEFCGDCRESNGCQKWAKHRAASRKGDSFVCYQRLERNIEDIRRDGLLAFENVQKRRQALLVQMLEGFNEGRSKTYYSIAATVMEPEELKRALDEARRASTGLDLEGRSRALHAALDAVASRKKYLLKLRR
jgi:hypothetical protein